MRRDALKPDGDELLKINKKSNSDHYIIIKNLLWLLVTTQKLSSCTCFVFVFVLFCFLGGGISASLKEHSPFF